MSTPTPARLVVEHRPDGSMTLAVTDLINGTETTTVLDEAERRSLLRAIVSGPRDVRGYVVLTAAVDNPERFDVAWDGLLHADPQDAKDEAGDALATGVHPEAHVGMVLAVLGGPDDQMPARSVEPADEPGPVTVYRRVGPHGVNGFAEHTHDGRPHGHDGGASPHRHPLFPGDDRDQIPAEQESTR